MNTNEELIDMTKLYINDTQTLLKYIEYLEKIILDYPNLLEQKEVIKIQNLRENFTNECIRKN